VPRAITMEMKMLWVGVLGVALGAGGLVVARGECKAGSCKTRAASSERAAEANEIAVVVDGQQPVRTTCPLEALGISTAAGKSAVVDATTRDGAPLHLDVNGGRLVRAAPAEAVLFKGTACNQMMFFSSAAALEAWKKDHPIDGRMYTMPEAVKLGASQPNRG
jgi:hypothetical protein